MKALISRLSNDRAKRYSGVYQIQGGMVTDADLGETTEIAKARVDELGGDAIGSGVPVNGGVVLLNANAVPSLRPGIVYADGVRGVVTTGGTLDPAKPLDLYFNQLDLAHQPALPANQPLVFYADVWECPVTLLMDARLTDVGLHGAETSFRTRTMAQIKAAPAADAADIRKASGAYPQRGNAVLKAELTTANAVVDPCDPCATEVASAARVGNALFRVEVQDVHGPADKPTQITLLWSIENAAERWPTSPVPPPAFTQRPASLFEFFSKTTEAHKGAFADPTTRRSSLIVAPYPAATPNEPDSGPWPHVRRWDGSVMIALNPLAIVGAPVNGAATIEAGLVKISLSAITFTLDVAGKAVLTGDHWLVELREFAADAAGKVHVESELPTGIMHHYATLFTTGANGLLVALPDDDRRRASFPTLADLPADHVSFDNNCPKLYGDSNTDGARNVQQALDRLCAINAADIDFTNNCPDMFEHATTVQQALDALCRLDFSPRLGYRLLFDWGVVCGVRVSLVFPGGERPPIIQITPGAILDRTGRLLVLPWKAPITIETLELPEQRDTNNEYCLCLVIAGELDVKIQLVNKTDPQLVRPEDRLYQQVVADCVKPHIKFSDILKSQFVDNQSVVKDRLVLAATGPQALGSTLKLTDQEWSEIGMATDAVIAELRPLLSTDQATELDSALAAADTRFNYAAAAGDAAQFVRGQNAIAKFNAIAGAARDPRPQCECDSYFPGCPGEDTGIPYVPIACVTFNRQATRFIEVCEYCCRKQALTPRTLRYWTGLQFEETMSRLRKQCCPSGDVAPGTPPVLINPRDPSLIDKGAFPLPIPIPEALVKWSPRPDVAGLNPAAATEVLVGHGVEVTHVIDLDSTDPLAFLAEHGASISATDRVGSGGTIKPGDSVALLTQGGVARDYVVLQRGDGKYLFPTGTEKITPSIDMTLVDSRLADAAQARDGLTAQIATLETRRNDLGSQVVNLKSDLDRLAASQTSITQSVEATKIAKATLDQDIAALVTQRDQLTQTVAGLKTSLGGMVAQRDEISQTVAGLKTSLGGMVAQRDEISQTVAGLKTNLDGLVTQRDQLTQTVTDLKTNLDGLVTQRDQLTQTVAGVKSNLGGMFAQQAQIAAEVATLQRQNQQLLQSVREAQPIAAAVGDNPALITQLSQAGVATVGDFQRLPAAQQTQIFTAANVAPTERTRIRTMVTRLITPGG